MGGKANLELCVLGGIAAHNGRDLSLGGPAPQRILAMLVMAEGDVVTIDQLAEATWHGDVDAARAEKNLHTYVSRLRSRFGTVGDQVIETRDRGYSLALGLEAVDSKRFADHARTGFTALRNGRLREALERLDAASALWASPPYGQFAEEPWAIVEVERLRELNRRVAESRGEALLRLGRVGDAIDTIEPLLLEDPYREQPRQLHMLALHRSGRTVDALRSFETFRVQLADDVGTTPSRELRDLDRQIANGQVDHITHELEVEVRGYQIHGLIGTGTFAEVFHGTQPGLKRPVAIKAIRSDLANLPDFIRAFEAEASVVARLEHPHIVPLYDYWREPDRAFLVMRWLSGGSLEDLLTDGPIDVEDAARLTIQISSALSTAHRAGIVHRDVKPANVLLDDERNFFLADFGIASEALMARSGRSESPATSNAPELIEKRPATPHVDQYLLARTLATAIDDDVSPKARDVLRRALDPDPAARYDHVERFAEAFVEAAVEGDSRASTSSRLSQPTITDPYVGLRPFDEHNHEVFHGRDDLTTQLVERLARGDRTVAVIGASGSGKSSVVRAGLLPALRAGAVRGSNTWFITTMTPGTRPFEALESALLRVAQHKPTDLLELMNASDRGIVRGIRRITADSDESVLVVIDQFEELFTLCEDEHERQRFLDGLSAALAEPRAPLRVVLTLRADFYDHPLRYAGFAELVRDFGVTVTPLSPEELERAIVTPAEQAGVVFERGLVAQIVAGVSAQPGGLPLLQHALSELYSRRIDRVMTTEAFAEIGGIDGAVARTAESLYLAADEHSRLAIESLFSRLVSLGEGTEDTRRRILREELVSSAEMDEAIENYVHARLLTVDRDLETRGHTLEVAHEALIREWPRLRALLDDNRDELRTHRLLGSASAQWTAGGHAVEDLYRGARLEAVEAWLSDGPTLNDQELAFIQASVHERERLSELEERRLQHSERQNTRLRRSLAAVGIVAVLLLLAGGLAVQQRSRANDEAIAATQAAALSESRRIAADAAQLVESDRRVALLLAAESNRRNPSLESLGALQQALIGSDNLLGYLGGGTSYEAVEWLNDETLVAATPTALELWHADGAMLQRLQIARIRSLSASADGRLVAGATPEGIVVVDTSTWTPQGVRRVSIGEVQALTFSPDGSLLAIGRRDGLLQLFDTELLQEIARTEAHAERTLEELSLGEAVALVGQHSPQATARGTLALSFDDEGTRIASGGWGYTRVWATADLSLVAEHPVVRTSGTQQVVDTVDAVGFAEDQDVLITVTRFASITARATDGSITSSATAELRESAGSTDITQLSSADVGANIYASVISGRVVQLTGTSGSLRTTLDPHVSESRDLAIGRNDTVIAIASDDGLVLMSTNGDGIIREFVAPASGNEAAVSASGELISISSAVADGAALVYRREPNGWSVVDLPEPQPDFLFPFFTSDERMIGYICPASCGDGDRQAEFVLIDPNEQKVFGQRQAPNVPGSAAITDDGRQLAFASEDGTIFVTDPHSGEVLWVFDALTNDQFVTSRSTNFNTAGTLLAASTEAGASAIFDLRTGEQRVVSAGGGSTTLIDFGPGPGEFTTASKSGEYVVRRLDDLQPTGRVLVGPAGSSGGPLGPVFTEDGSIMIATNSARAQLVDVKTGVGIGVPIPSTADIPASASRSGRFVISSDGDNIFRYDLDTRRWPELACQAAGRNLTEVEWEKFGPSGEPYAPTCPQYPALGSSPTEE